MQNGRNRIAAHGRTKAGNRVGKARAPQRSRGKDARAVAHPKIPSTGPVFPLDVVVALPPGSRHPATRSASNGKEQAAARRKVHVAHPPRKPGRKKRAARQVREAVGEQIVAIVPAQVGDADAQVSSGLATDASEAASPAVSLPVAAEPLVVTVEQRAPVGTAERDAAELPRHRAVMRPQMGLIAAISAWLRSSRKLLLLGLLPRRKRVALPRPRRELPIALQRPREELEQLRDENHDLRRKLAAFEAERGRRLLRG